MPPETTIWERRPHTIGKHIVLREYLNKWYPSLGSWKRRILFIDGFAGPGEYEGGEDGSPVIALNTLLDHRAKDTFKAELVYLLIEDDKRRVAHLEELVARLRPKLPSKCFVKVVQGKFAETLDEILGYIVKQEKALAPAFVMLDPFGVSGIPMRIIERIFENPRCEVFVSFMYESINRHKKAPEFCSHLEQLFGCDKWKEGNEIKDSAERKRFFYDLYESQLRNAGAKYVVHLDIYAGNRLKYAVFFGTQHVKGCNGMKRAIWKADPTGKFSFRHASSEQQAIKFSDPSFGPLEKILRQEFQNKGWVGIESVTKFVMSDRTGYHDGHLKRQTLVPMENKGTIEIRNGTRTKGSTYPDGTMLRFL